jgi:polygalacturonase
VHCPQCAGGIGNWPWDAPTKLWPADANVGNVRAFGAVGDGVTDDTRAVEAAWIASGSGGRLYFPAGVYLVSRPLQVRAPVGAYMAASQGLGGG